MFKKELNSEKPKFKTEIVKLAEKAAKESTGAGALKFSQAALNLAHAASVIAVTE